MTINKKPVGNQQSSELTRRTNSFMDFFDLCEENGISLSSFDFQQISQFAVKDVFIDYAGQPINSLVDLNIENLSDKDATTIIKRARTALKRILEMRTRYSAGPFKTNRHLRRIQQKLNKATTRRYKPS